MFYVFTTYGFDYEENFWVEKVSKHETLKEALEAYSEAKKAVKCCLAEEATLMNFETRITIAKVFNVKVEE